MDELFKRNNKNAAFNESLFRSQRIVNTERCLRDIGCQDRKMFERYKVKGREIYRVSSQDREMFERKRIVKIERCVKERGQSRQKDV